MGFGSVVGGALGGLTGIPGGSALGGYLGGEIFDGSDGGGFGQGTNIGQQNLAFQQKMFRDQFEESQRWYGDYRDDFKRARGIQESAVLGPSYEAKAGLMHLLYGNPTASVGYRTLNPRYGEIQSELDILPKDNSLDQWVKWKVETDPGWGESDLSLLQAMNANAHKGFPGVHPLEPWFHTKAKPEYGAWMAAGGSKAARDPLEAELAGLSEYDVHEFGSPFAGQTLTDVLERTPGYQKAMDDALRGALYQSRASGLSGSGAAQIAAAAASERAATPYYNQLIENMFRKAFPGSGQVAPQPVGYSPISTAGVGTAASGLMDHYSNLGMLEELRAVGENKEGSDLGGILGDIFSKRTV